MPLAVVVVSFVLPLYIYIYVRERGLLGLAVSIVQFGGVLGIREKKGRVANTGFQLLFKLIGR
jgi:hypothetical protein